MAVFALVLYGLGALLTFGVRAYLQWRRTGKTGMVGLASGGGVRDAAIGLGFVLSLELHVRLVEEPYLLRVHGRAYERYTTAVGRFLPLIGRAAAGSGPFVPGGPAGG